MKSYRKFIVGTFLSLSLLSLVVIGAGLWGCSAEQIENTADDVSYVAGGPTTQPTTRSAVLETAHTIVKLASDAAPPVKAIASVVGILAAGIGALVGHANGKRVQTKQSNSIISEIVGDVAAFKNPSQPWTASAEKLLTDLGYVEAAVTQPVPPQA